MPTSGTPWQDRSLNGPTAWGPLQIYTTYNRTTAAPPNAALVSQYAGERVLDTSTGILYQALIANVNNSWQVAAIAKHSGA